MRPIKFEASRTKICPTLQAQTLRWEDRERLLWGLHTLMCSTVALYVEMLVGQRIGLALLHIEHGTNGLNFTSYGSTGRLRKQYPLLTTTVVVSSEEQPSNVGSSSWGRGFKISWRILDQIWTLFMGVILPSPPQYFCTGTSHNLASSIGKHKDRAL